MAASGTILRWRAEDLGGPVVDKHSTGGIGDKCEFPSGADRCSMRLLRADDLRSGSRAHRRYARQDRQHSRLPFHSDLATFQKVVGPSAAPSSGRPPILPRRTGVSTRSGTSPAPWNRFLLITASILSKKIAAGLDALVMDVKVGSGAFMASMDRHKPWLAASSGRPVARGSRLAH